MRFLWSAVFAISFAGAVWAADDEQDTPSKLSDADKARAYDDLAGRVKKLEEASKTQANALEWYWKDGIRFKTADGNFEGHAGGRVMIHLRFVIDRPDGAGGAIAGATPANNFFFRENYLQLDGTILKQFEYKIQANFFAANANAGPFASLSDCYLGWRPAKEFGFRVGQMEVPFSQEEIESTLFIDCNERSVINRMSPVRDLGFEFFGALAEGILQYELGVFNGTQIGGSNNTRNLNDNNDEKDIAARLRLMPFKTTDLEWIKQLRIGVAGTYGFEGNIAPPGVAGGYPPLTSVATGTAWGVTTAVNNSRRERLGAEVSYVLGPASLRGEFIHMRLDDTSTANAPTFMSGYYVQATCILTGESKADEGRLTPKNPVDVGAGQWGAVELVARWAVMNANNLLAQGLMAVGSNARIEEITFGVNWWLTSFMRWSVDYIHNHFDAPLTGAGGPLLKENAILARFQIDF